MRGIEDESGLEFGRKRFSPSSKVGNLGASGVDMTQRRPSRDYVDANGAI